TKTKIPLIPSSTGASHIVPLPSLQASNTIVSVILKKADITQENVDVIVNSSNQNLDLNTGVSGDILKAAGQSVVDEYLLFLAQGPLRSNDAGVTSGGSLQCDFIIHIVGPKSVEQAVERVKNVLKHCEDKNIPSVSFPAIGTGNSYSGSSWLDARFRLVDLSPTSEQYKKIQRIQSKDQWQRYALQKQVLDEKYPHNKNEMDLYHGTTAEICRKVNSNGFNRSFCGRNATLYGNGTYFAKQSWYSCNDKYSNPDAQGLKYMYQARVLVGKPCLGTPGMVEPAPLDPNNPYSGLHDCAVNNVQNPFIYVVFSDAGAYPDYLISYKASL
uniref:Poly [ADP-ribose] polymerase n=1 Tax=Gadus morhua TaxID=8049 RepID=A0A8C5BK85_GADMO